jgi:hypothetical protein
MTVSKLKFFIGLSLAISILMIQTGGVFAAPALQPIPTITGAIQSITLETYSATGSTVVIVTVTDSNDVFQTARIDEKAAKDLGLVMFDSDGKLSINNSALGQLIEIKPEMVLTDQENRHPVGNALATFFSNIQGLDYDTIMLAHSDGIGFGVIAQALWLTAKLEGSAEDFQALLRAKETGDYTEFSLDDGSTPKNWAELRKSLFEGKKVKNPGSVISDQENGNVNNPEPNQDQENKKEKNKDKEKEKGQNKDNGGDNNDNGKQPEKDGEKKNEKKN